jgi:UDP:flavonoid glycosyltransferase YjiC (YdhE family)
MEMDGLPPAWWGLSTVNPDHRLWQQKRQVRDAIYKPVMDRLNDWRVRKGLKPHDKFLMAYWSPFLNVYNYPKEMDYYEHIDLPAPMGQLDSCVRRLPDSFELPAEFLAIPGKHTVYVSMGTLASINANLMQRIVDALGDTPNRYFVSKGANGDQLKLPANCYGANFVPQTEILPLVDAIITHGGNNTFTECFYFGVPMIVMPFFSDQPDNAQRLVDKGLGLFFSLSSLPLFFYRT